LANSATATTPTRHHPKILPLESLRGLLAVWVLAAHVAGRSLLDSQIAAARLNALTEPLLPVYVFMILFYKARLIEFIHIVFGKSDQQNISRIISATKSVIQR